MLGGRGGGGWGRPIGLGRGLHGVCSLARRLRWRRLERGRGQQSVGARWLAKDTKSLVVVVDSDREDSLRLVLSDNVPATSQRHHENEGEHESDDEGQNEGEDEGDGEGQGGGAGRARIGVRVRRVSVRL